MKVKKLFLLLSLPVLSATALAQVIPAPTNQAALDANLQLIAADTKVDSVVGQYVAETDLRFIELLEVTRISSPSRQEYYRAKELRDRLVKTSYFDAGDIVFTGQDGVMPGAGIQLVDGRPVFQTCAVIKGSAEPIDGTNPYSTPKVVIEGHIDTVNPANIPGFDPSNPEPLYQPVKLDPAGNNLVQTAAELAALPYELRFDARGRVIQDDYLFYQAMMRWDSVADAAANGGYRIYVPGIGDAMGNTINVYYLAKLFKRNNILPVYDIWFCFTAGEEGRGNIAGMKQLYGYKQQNYNAPQPDDMSTEDKLEFNGRNTLNIVANMSIDGGAMTVNYLGSHRYEVNYTDYQPAMAAARAINLIAQARTPEETAGQTAEQSLTTYTVGIAYPKEDGSVSFEIDMRSPTAEGVTAMDNILRPMFTEGAALEAADSGQASTATELWYGDRPPRVASDAALAADPLVYLAFKTYNDQVGTLNSVPTGSSSLNDNIPAAMGVPTANMDLNVNSGWGGHAFNEGGIRGQVDGENKQMRRIVYMLLALSGMRADDGTVLVEPPYPPTAPRYKSTGWGE
jgi:acetylornithine deacetylase/succinyl-diaminopimelate desuccinylase-like protein